MTATEMPAAPPASIVPVNSNTGLYRDIINPSFSRWSQTACAGKNDVLPILNKFELPSSVDPSQRQTTKRYRAQVEAALVRGLKFEPLKGIPHSLSGATTNNWAFLLPIKMPNLAVAESSARKAYIAALPPDYRSLIDKIGLAVSEGGATAKAGEAAILALIAIARNCRGATAPDSVTIDRDRKCFLIERRRPEASHVVYVESDGALVVSSRVGDHRTNAIFDPGTCEWEGVAG